MYGNYIGMKKKLPQTIFTIPKQVDLTYASNGQHQPTQPQPTIATAGGNGPLAPHMRPCAPCRCVEWMGDNPPSKRICFLGLLREFMALKTLQCCGNSSQPERFEGHNTLNPPKEYIRKLGGLSPIHLKRRRGAQGLMWGARGPFLPAAAMVVAVVMPVAFCAKATEKRNKTLNLVGG